MKLAKEKLTREKQRVRYWLLLKFKSQRAVGAAVGNGNKLSIQALMIGGTKNTDAEQVWLDFEHVLKEKKKENNFHPSTSATRSLIHALSIT